MQLSPSPKLLLLLLSLTQHVVSSPRQGGGQVVLAPPTNAHTHDDDNNTPAPANAYAEAHAGHVVDESILAALDAHADPVDALVSLQPELAAQLAAPRLIHVFGEAGPEWRTEGDKLHLRRQHKKFMDITDHQDLYTGSVHSTAGKASKK